MLTFQRILEPASKLKNFEREERYFGKYNLSPARMIDSLNAVSGVHLQQNHYMFDYYDKMVECIGNTLGIAFSRRILPWDEIRSLLAATKK
mgnify:CR=1 FL=1|jgi:hypothetical protein